MNLVNGAEEIAVMPSQSPGVELHWRKDGARKTPIIKDRAQGRYHRVSVGCAWVWSLCNGERSIDSISETIAAKGGPADPMAVATAVRRLAADGLVNGVAAETVLSDKDSCSLAARCYRFLTWRVTFSQVDPMMAWLYEHVGFVAFKPIARFLFLSLMGSGFIAFIAFWLLRSDPYGRLDANWAYCLPLFLAFTVLPHEAAHAMANKHFKRDVNGAGFGWFWLGPVFYVDTSDMWLAGRRERVLVGIAGTISDLTIAGTCSLLAWLVPAPWSGIVSAAAAALYLVVLGNMSPLLEYDGYYVLSDILDRPNLRRRSLSRVCNALKRWPIQWPDLVQDKIELAYSIGSLAYAFFLLTSNAYFSHAFFSGLFGDTGRGFTAIATWASTIVILLVFLLGLVNDIVRSGRNSSFQSGRT